MPTFDTIRTGADNRSLVRKIQKAVAFFRRKSEEGLPTSLYEGGSLVDLKAAGWIPLGLVSPDGYTFAGERENATVDALGYSTSIRSDVTKVPRTIATTALESGKKAVEELKRGVDLTNVTQDPTTGEITYDEGALPVDKEYELIVVGADGPPDAEWIMGKGYPSVKLANLGDEVWGGEDAVASEITLDVFTDDKTGTPVRHFLAGTGALKHKDILGYTQAVPGP